MAVETQQGSKVKELEAQKLALIERYMKMQDEADDLNERIYNICCEIETLNLSISKAKEEEEKKKAAAPKAPHSSNGNGKLNAGNGDHPAR